jgi:hypothetical protein
MDAIGGGGSPIPASSSRFTDEDDAIMDRMGGFAPTTGNMDAIGGGGSPAASNRFVDDDDAMDRIGGFAPGVGNIDAMGGGGSSPAKIKGIGGGLTS